jgi:hypothetical protein
MQKRKKRLSASIIPVHLDHIKRREMVSSVNGATFSFMEMGNGNHKCLTTLDLTFDGRNMSE